MSQLLSSLNGQCSRYDLSNTAHFEMHSGSFTIALNSYNSTVESGIKVLSIGSGVIKIEIAKMQFP